jgi:sec-independent protein translocase protein TatB
MFDITSSKLLILAIVALIVVGPKDLPILLRTVGKYLGMIRRQAAEFRHQFDEAMRESELDQLKKEFENVSREVRATMDEGSRAIDSQIAAASTAVEAPRFGIGKPATPAASMPNTPSTGIAAPSTDLAASETPADSAAGHTGEAEPPEPGRGAA